MMMKYLKYNYNYYYDKEINIAKGSIIFVFAILDQWPLIMAANIENVLSCQSCSSIIG